MSSRFLFLTLESVISVWIHTLLPQWPGLRARVPASESLSPPGSDLADLGVPLSQMSSPHLGLSVAAWASPTPRTPCTTPSGLLQPPKHTMSLQCHTVTELLLLPAWDSLPERATWASVFPAGHITCEGEPDNSLFGTTGIQLKQPLLKVREFLLVPSSLLHSHGCLTQSMGGGWRVGTMGWRGGLSEYAHVQSRKENPSLKGKA